jgi:ribosomal protein L12E/L44/L45/RPP1/RPP2
MKSAAAVASPAKAGKKEEPKKEVKKVKEPEPEEDDAPLDLFG